MIRGLEDLVREFARDVHELAIDQLTADLHDVAPRDTGALIESFFSETSETYDGFSTDIGFRAEYASYTDEGVDPRPIFPRNAQALQFFWPDGPEGAGTYTFNSVNHPGIEATHWFTDAIETWPTVVQDAMR